MVCNIGSLSILITDIAPCFAGRDGPCFSLEGQIDNAVKDHNGAVVSIALFFFLCVHWFSFLHQNREPAVFHLKNMVGKKLVLFNQIGPVDALDNPACFHRSVDRQRNYFVD